MVFEVRLRHRIGERSISIDLASAAPLTALVGLSGAGKSTVLNCIAGLIRPDSGSIRIGGRMLFDSDSGVEVPPERRGAGYVFQDLRLFPHMRVARNITFGARLAPAGASALAGAEAQTLLGIAPLMDRWPATLSGGEARRVAIARALNARPRFLLLDEPTASLDARSAKELMHLIETIRDRLAIPILLVSHNHAEVTRLAGEIVELS